MQNEQEPSEAILKLILPFLDGKELIKNGDLVCRRWRISLLSDDVWRPVCDSKIAWYEMVVRNRKENFMEDITFDSPKHYILTNQMDKQSMSGRSYREIFILSETMGHVLLMHELYGPDYGRASISGDERPLRTRCIHDYQWIVGEHHFVTNIHCITAVTSS